MTPQELTEGLKQFTKKPFDSTNGTVLTSKLKQSIKDFITEPVLDLVSIRNDVKKAIELHNSDSSILVFIQNGVAGPEIDDIYKKLKWADNFYESLLKLPDQYRQADYQPSSNAVSYVCCKIYSTKTTEHYERRSDISTSSLPTSNFSHSSS